MDMKSMLLDIVNQQETRARELQSIPDTVIKTGDEVMWRGSWGDDKPEKTIIECIERTEHEHEKYGDEVDEVPFVNGNWNFPFCCTLKNGHWAYSYQITPLK